MLKTIYPDSYATSSAQANVASITFAGTVVGMLFFGYTSDHFSRKWSLFTSTIIIILFAILGTASYGAGGSPSGLLTALVVYRFFLGIGTYFCRKLYSSKFDKRTNLRQALAESTQRDL
jgi:MFS family permease